MKVPRPLQTARRSLFSRPGRRSDSETLPLQTAALPWRLDPSGGLEVLLITSRSSGQWIIPKGQPMAGKTLAQAAAIEAFEEAGVEGRIDARPIGEFEHLKSHWLMGSVPFLVVVHGLAVDRVLAHWPEQAERERRWLRVGEAAELVRSAELTALLREFEARWLHAEDRR